MNNAIANDVFGMISHAEKYGSNIIDIIVINEEPWFKGNDISKTLSYSDYSKAVRNNVDAEDRMSLRQLLAMVQPSLLDPKYDLNQLKTTYINESGLFSLILGSRLESAKKFKRWITKEVLPKIRKSIDHNYLSEFTEFKRIILEKDLNLEASLVEISILKKNKKDLSKYLRNMEPVVKNQIFYLATSTEYAHQNIFEFGGCKSSKEVPGRLSNYNTGRAEGDLMYFCKIYHCTDYRIIEEIVHRILAKFKDKEGSRKEMIRLRYNRIVEVIDAITENYDRHIDYLNDQCQVFLEESVYLDPIVPEPLDLKDHLELNFISAGRVVRTKSIEITKWSPEKIDLEFARFINEAAKETHPDYDFDLHKKSVRLSHWRTAIKEWYNRHTPFIQIRGIKF